MEQVTLPTQPRQQAINTLKQEAIDLVGGNGAFAFSPKHFMLDAIHGAADGTCMEAPSFARTYGLSVVFAGIDFEDMIRLDSLIEMMQMHQRAKGPA